MKRLITKLACWWIIRQDLAVSAEGLCRWLGHGLFTGHVEPSAVKRSWDFCKRHVPGW